MTGKISLVGITSVVPATFPLFLRNRHYLLIDCDVKKPSAVFDVERWLVKHRIIENLTGTFFEVTPHGFHLAVFKPFKFEELVYLMPHIPHIDLNFYRIGVERGYWFIVTYGCVMRKNVCFMRIKVPEGCEWLAKKAQDA